MIYIHAVSRSACFIYTLLWSDHQSSIFGREKKSLTGSGWIRYTVWLSYSRQKNRQFYLILYILINFLLLLLKITIFKGVYFIFLCCWFFLCHWVNYLKCHCYYNISQYLFLIDIYISMLIFFFLIFSLLVFSVKYNIVKS